jgi:hypothetical protein
VEWLLIAFAAAGGALGVRRLRRRGASHRADQEGLESVREVADEDVTTFGEQLQRLGEEVEGQQLDEQTRTHYQAALDGYESAKRAVPRIKDMDQISTVTDTLAGGRYQLTCVQARLAGRPVPEFRVPCFFNPQHGPSTTTVTWTPRSRGTRRVPACAQDAARVEAHEEPDVRMVRMGARRIPYWEAGATYYPYSEGYFAGALTMAWVFQAPPWTAADGGAGGGHGWGDGGGGHDVGGFDGGGGGGDG